MFDDGRLTDGKGRVVDFTNTIIIATSNLGSDIIQRNLKKRGTKEFDEAKQKSELMDVLRGHFRPEFINRIDEIIVFHSLNQTEIRQIVELQLNRVKRTALGQGVELEFDVSVVDHFGAVGFRPEFGARELRRLIRSELETELAREMLSGRIEDGDKVRVAWSADEQKVVFEKIAKDTGDNSPDDQAEAGIDESSEAAENKADAPTPDVPVDTKDREQSKDDKSIG